MANKTRFSKETIEFIYKCLREGDSNKVACMKAGVGYSTFYDWIEFNPAVKDGVKKCKEEFRATILEKLEASLWQRAMGYEVTETDTEYVCEADGTLRVKSKKEKKKHILPDTAALIFALTNVAPEKWVNKQKVETQEAKPDDSKKPSYCFEDLPESLLFDIADKLQAAVHDKMQEKKGGGDGNT